MKATLQDSIRQAGHMEGYARGSIVLCAQCLVPLYELTRSIDIGEKAHRSVSAYRPLSAHDLDQLAQRDTTEPGVAAMLGGWTLERKRQHAAAIPELHTGSPALCPACGQSFVQVRALEAAEVIDRAYTFELVTLAPRRPLSERLVRAWTRPESLSVPVLERPAGE